MIFYIKIKHQSFLQGGSIVVTGHNQACPRHLKEQVSNIFAISKKEGRTGVGFLHADKHQTILQFNTINLGGHSQTCPNTQNNNFAKSLQYIKKQ